MHVPVYSCMTQACRACQRCLSTWLYSGQAYMSPAKTSCYHFSRLLAVSELYTCLRGVQSPCFCLPSSCLPCLWNVVHTPLVCGVPACVWSVAHIELLAIADKFLKGGCCPQAELLTGAPLFPGTSDIDQLHLQQQLLGPLPYSPPPRVGPSPSLSRRAQSKAQANPLINLRDW